MASTKLYYRSSYETERVLTARYSVDSDLLEISLDMEKHSIDTYLTVEQAKMLKRTIDNFIKSKENETNKEWD